MDQKNADEINEKFEMKIFEALLEREADLFELHLEDLSDMSMSIAGDVLMTAIVPAVQAENDLHPDHGAAL